MGAARCTGTTPALQAELPTCLQSIHIPSSHQTISSMCERTVLRRSNAKPALCCRFKDGRAAARLSATMSNTPTVFNSSNKCKSSNSGHCGRPEEKLYEMRDGCRSQTRGSNRTRWQPRWEMGDPYAPAMFLPFTHLLFNF